jgi:type VI protein secretion system component VasK
MNSARRKTGFAPYFINLKKERFKYYLGVTFIRKNDNQGRIFKQIKEDF